MPSGPRPTEGERANGWDAASLADYLAERDGATAARDGKPLTGGNVVMPWQRPRPMPRIETTHDYDPFEW